MSPAAATSIRCGLSGHRTAALVIVLVGALGVTATLAQAQAPPETVEYYATDALGSVRVVYNSTGQVLGRSNYLPFGETLNQNGALPRQRFTGQERDGEAGLDYFNARDLQTRTGRMNAPDPLFSGAMSNPQAWNRYAYVGNNPLTLVDPSGMDMVDPQHIQFSVAVFKATTVGNLQPMPYADWFGGGGDFWGVSLPFDWGSGQYDGGGGSMSNPGGDGGGSADTEKDGTTSSPTQPEVSCPTIPTTPLGVNVDENIRIAQGMRPTTHVFPTVSLAAWYYTVRNHGPWDYKQLGSEYEPFGNFNFGAAGAAWGIPLNVLQRGAGFAQQRAGTSDPRFGTWYGGFPYGDDPNDQALITAGYLNYQLGCYAKR
jgi:RHS repeat-associated protein